MHFTVKPSGYDSYEVRLADKTKDKIKHAAMITYWSVVGGVLSIAAVNHVMKDKVEAQEEPQQES